MPQARSRFVIWCFCLLLTVYSSLTLHAQIADDELALLLAQNRISIQTLTVFFATARRTANLDTERRAQIDKIAADLIAAQRAGRFGETRRQIFQGFALMRGKPWTAKEEFAASLVLRSNGAISDSNRPQMLSLSQVFPVAYNYQATPKLRITVAENSTNRRELSSPGKIVKEIGIYDGLASDLADEPFVFEADLRGIKDGFYLLCAEFLDGDTTIRKIWTNVFLVQNLDSLKADIERRLSKVKIGSEGTKASIRYPFEWARQINFGRREMPRGDFASEVDRSIKLLDSLEKGKDSLYQAIGDNKRHYYFAEADEIMPYRLYVPSNYDGRKKFPLIVALHGLGGTEDTFLNRYNGLMKKLAEENGYILVAPLGYRINGGYGRQTRNLPDLQRRKILEFSEKDVMNVVGRMREEYKIDDKRLFLMGHSMGGTGTWTLGVKYAGMWAALAPIAPGYTPDEDVTDLSRLKEMPILVSHGSKDKTAPPELSRRTVAELKKLGINPEFLEIPSADHETIVPTVLPKIFEFFNRQNKPDRVAVNEQTSEISAYKPNDGEYRVATVEEIILHDEKRSKDVPIKIYYPANISEQFPVIIFSHGSGGSKDTYPELARYWASHGFIVILPTHADSIALRRRQGERVTRETAFGGQAVNPELWTSRPLDISLVIDRLAEIERLAPELKGRINSRKIGAGGHSFGAYTAQLIGGATIKLENKEKLVSFADIRVAAVLLLSAPGRDQKGLVTGSWDNFSTPLMNITGSNDRVSGAKGLNGERWLPDTKTESFKFSRPGDKYLVFIEGAYHGLGGISGQNTQFARTVGGPGNSRHISYVKTASLAFWDFYLKSDKQAKNYLESKKLEQFSKGEAVLSRR